MFNQNIKSMAKMIRVKTISSDNTNFKFIEWFRVEHITRVIDTMNSDPTWWKDVKKLDACCEVWFNDHTYRYVIESAESLVKRIERSLMGE